MTRNNVFTTGLLLTLLAILAPASSAREQESPVGEWADLVWDAALKGESQSLERYFRIMPSESVEADSAGRFNNAFEQLLTNRKNAFESRSADREEALTEMRTEIEANRHSKALRSAVKFQSLSDDLNSVFTNDEVMELVGWAEARIPVLEAQGDWLEAQELVYLLRTFFEDTVRQAEHERYDEELMKVNRRVALLALYAPARLHEMRNLLAERLGEEPVGEFNPATAIDWRERLDGIEFRMVMSALRSAAYDHIEDQGWRPLLEGGIEALQIMATTDALAETFPMLGEPAVVERWLHSLEVERKALATFEDRDLRGQIASKMIDDLLIENERTLQLPQEVVLREFGDGAMMKLDIYSEIIWPSELRRFEQATQGNFVGVGIQIHHNDKREIEVEKPLEGTPAYFGGVKPGDLIVEVNSDPTFGWSLNDAVDRITGPKGTVVTLGLRREGLDELVEIPLERDFIKLPSVKGWWKLGLDERGEAIWDWYIDSASQIAYIRLTQFSEETTKDLLEAWMEITAAGDPHGLILDLRHNPGGLLTAAVDVSTLFVPDGSIVTGEDKDGRQAWEQNAKRQRAALAGVDTVILINKGSASASEIVAGCLQAHNVAIIIGERSFGKGSVQTVQPIQENARLKLTTQYYRLPSIDGGQTKGRLVHRRPGSDEWGVDPDVPVKMSDVQVRDAIMLWQESEMIMPDDEGEPDESAVAAERPNPERLLTDGIDPQLETALLILRAQALRHDEVRHARLN